MSHLNENRVTYAFCNAANFFPREVASVSRAVNELESCVKTCEEKAEEMLSMTEVPKGYVEALNSASEAVADFEKAAHSYVTVLHAHPENYHLLWLLISLCEVNRRIVISTFTQLFKCR